MNEPTQSERKPPARWLAILITVVFLALFAQDMIRDGSADPTLGGFLVVLAFFWMGQAIDNLPWFR